MPERNQFAGALCWHALAGLPRVVYGATINPLQGDDQSSDRLLEKTEIDALLGQPDRRDVLGARDHAFPLYLYNSGSRADEAERLGIGNLRLDASPAVTRSQRSTPAGARLSISLASVPEAITRILACRKSGVTARSAGQVGERQKQHPFFPCFNCSG